MIPSMPTDTISLSRVPCHLNSSGHDRDVVALFICNRSVFLL